MSALLSGVSPLRLPIDLSQATPAQGSTRRIMMQHTPTDSSKGSTRSRERVFVVLSLADQKLTLEHDGKLEWFQDGKSHCHPNSRPEKDTDVCEGLVTSAEKKEISRNPFKRTMRLKISKPSSPDEKLAEPDEEEPKSPCFYPVDIRLDSAARYMWIRRLLGLVDGVRVYTGPLAKL